MLVKLFQIRMSDKAIVFKFYDETTNEEAGSRGVNAGRDFDDALFDEIVNNMTIFEFYKLKTEGFTLSDKSTAPIGQVAKIAYDQLMQARQVEEEEKAMVIE